MLHPNKLFNGCLGKDTRRTVETTRFGSVRLSVMGTQRHSLCEKSTFTARHSSRGTASLKRRSQSCAKKYFQKVQVSLRSWRSARQNSPTKYGKLNWRGKTDSQFPVDAGFACDKAPVTTPALCDIISGIRCTNNQRPELPMQEAYLLQHIHDVWEAEYIPVF